MEAKNNSLFFFLLVAVICASTLSLLFNFGFFSNVQLTLSDALYGGGVALDNIKIVAIDDQSLQEIGRWPWNRGVFAQLVEKLASADVVGVDVAFFEESNSVIDDVFSSAVRKAGNVVLPVEYLSFESVDGRIKGDEILLPYSGLGDSALELAYINIITDGDGISRAYNLDLSSEFDNFPHAVYKNFVNGGREFDDSRFLVNFVGAPGSFSRISVSDVLNGEMDFSGSIVLVGATAPDLHDEVFVPTSSGKAMPGVEVHANAIQSMILGNQLQKQEGLVVVLLIFFFSIIAMLVTYKLDFLSGSLMVFVIGLLYIFYAIFAFGNNVIYNLVYPLLSLFLSFFLITGYSLVVEQKHKKEIVGLFGKYVSPAVLDDMIHTPDKVKLGGEKREITVQFSDIRGFTTISEKLSPEALVHLLNDYLTEMTSIIMKKEGVVDKYMGDAIMAFWGAPLIDSRHAEHACSSALQMMTRLKELQRKWESEGVPSFDIGIGLNTGNAVVGNMGSYERFDYTAMGDAVNLGSRLEGINKEYGTNIIISESTYLQVKDKFICRKLDRVKVKGKKEPAVIYELVAEGFDKSVISNFEKGLSLYFSQKFDDALALFLKNENDVTSNIFVKRCEKFLVSAPSASWDGVWVMKSK